MQILKKFAKSTILSENFNLLFADRESALYSDKNASTKDQRFFRLIQMYSRLSLSRSRRDPPKNFKISVLRHIRCAELRIIPIEQPNFTNEHVI